MNKSKKIIDLIMVTFVLIILLSIKQPVTAYTPCEGVQRNDIVNIHYAVMVGSPDAEAYQSTYGGDPFIATVNNDSLIQGFYEGLLGMLIHERKTIEVPPSKGYTSESHELYGEWLYFDTLLNEVVDGYSSECEDTLSSDNSSEANNSSSLDIDLPVLTIPITILSIWFLSITTYRRRKKSYN